MKYSQSHAWFFVAAVALFAAFGALASGGESEPCELPEDPALLLDYLWPFVDTNSDGILSYSEAQAVYPDLTPQLYAYADLNHDGKVVKSEVLALAPLLGDNFLDYIDTNHNGVIEYAEVSEYVTRDQFNQLDRNGNGIIDCGDLPDGGGGGSEGGSEPTEGQVEGDDGSGHEGEAEGDDGSGHEGETEGDDGSGHEGETEGDDGLPCPIPNDPELILSVLWPLADSDGDGSLSLSEAQAIYPDLPPSLFEYADTNDDGYVDYREAQALLPLLPPDWLSYVDTNGNGVIEYGEVSDYVTPEQFAQVDVNHDNVIDCVDFMVVQPGEGEAEGDDGSGHEGEVEGDDGSGHEGEAEGDDGSGHEGEVEGDDGSGHEGEAEGDDGSGHEGEVEGDDGSGHEGEVEIECEFEDLYSVFHLALSIADANHDGFLSVEEASVLANALAGDGGSVGELDLNGDGFITPDEIRALAAMFGSIDEDGNGSISYDEAAAIIPGLTQEQFNALDINGNGLLDCDDLRHLIIGRDPMQLLLQLLRQIFVLLDRNGDDCISYSEIRDLYPVPRDVFEALDADHNGCLTREEILAALGGGTGGGDTGGGGTGGGGTGGSTGSVTLNQYPVGNGFYEAGGQVTIEAVLQHTDSSTIAAIGLREIIPAGWTLAAILQDGGADVQPSVGATDVLEFAWIAVPPFPVTVTFVLNVPPDASLPVAVVGEGFYRFTVGGELSTGAVATPLAPGVVNPAFAHKTDMNGDWRVSLNELLRLIQFYNSGGLHCSPGSEDGYEAGAGGDTACGNHSADYLTPNWRIELSELLRVVQFYNSPNRAYHRADGTEDGFAPGPFQVPSL